MARTCRARHASQEQSPNPPADNLRSIGTGPGVHVVEQIYLSTFGIVASATFAGGRRHNLAGAFTLAVAITGTVGGTELTSPQLGHSDSSGFELVERPTVESRKKHHPMVSTAGFGRAASAATLLDDRATPTTATNVVQVVSHVGIRRVMR